MVDVAKLREARTLIITSECPVCGHEFSRHDPEDGGCDVWPGGDHCDSLKVVAFLAAVALVGLPEALDEQAK